MKLSVLFFALFASLSAHAGNELFGHWQGQNISFDGKNGSANTFNFQVKDKKIASFLSCAANKNSDDEVFLSGPTGTSEITEAFICAGQVNLGLCDNKQYVCNNDNYLSRQCKSQALAFANAGLSIQEGVAVKGDIVRSSSARGVDGVSETYDIEAIAANGKDFLPLVRVTLVPVANKCMPWAYSLPEVN